MTTREREREQKLSHKKKEAPRYQDFVIKNGKLVGDFEGLYKNFDDPWHQSRNDHLHDSRRSLAVNWCNRLREQYGATRVIELGCGFGHLSQVLRQQNFSVIGTDISKTAIEKAREINSNSVFVQCALSEFDKLELFEADIYLMAEITWYVLDDLDDFIKNLKKAKKQRKKPIFLIHLLTTYATGVQKYGADKFTNLDEILKYFNLNYLESGFIRTPREDDENSQGTYFAAKI
jgi:SAM-dependent methyltransferase